MPVSASTASNAASSCWAWAVVLAVGGGGDRTTRCVRALELRETARARLAHGRSEVIRVGVGGSPGSSSNEPDSWSPCRRWRRTQVDLGHESAQDGSRGLAPALGLGAQTLEVLLERER